MRINKFTKTCLVLLIFLLAANLLIKHFHSRELFGQPAQPARPQSFEQEIQAKIEHIESMEVNFKKPLRYIVWELDEDERSLFPVNICFEAFNRKGYEPILMTGYPDFRVVFRKKQ